MEKLHTLQQFLRRGLMHAGRVFNPVVAVQRVLRLVAGKLPLVGSLCLAASSKLLRHGVRYFDKLILYVPRVKILQIDGCHL